MRFEEMKMNEAMEVNGGMIGPISPVSPVIPIIVTISILYCRPVFRCRK